MKTSLESKELSVWMRRPFCRKYSVVVQRSLDLAVRCPGEECPRSAYWLYGQLADGESEPLGAWFRSDAIVAERTIPTALKNRGLEHFRYLCVEDDGKDACGLLAGYPRATLVNVECLEAECPASLREALVSAMRTAGDIHARLSRSIRRQGSFKSPDAALDFVAATLQRVERRMDRERAIAKVRPRLDSGSQMAGSAI